MAAGGEVNQESVMSQKLREHGFFRREWSAASGTAKMSSTIGQTGNADPTSISLEQFKQKPNCTVLRSELKLLEVKTDYTILGSLTEKV